MIHKVRNNMKLYLFEDLIQNIKSDCNDVFQLCFYDHLFGPNNDRKIKDHETIFKNIVQTLLNELF